MDNLFARARRIVFLAFAHALVLALQTAPLIAQEGLPARVELYSGVGHDLPLARARVIDLIRAARDRVTIVASAVEHPDVWTELLRAYAWGKDVHVYLDARAWVAYRRALDLGTVPEPVPGRECLMRFAVRDRRVHPLRDGVPVDIAALERTLADPSPSLPPCEAIPNSAIRIPHFAICFLDYSHLVFSTSSWADFAPAPGDLCVLAPAPSDATAFWTRAEAGLRALEEACGVPLRPGPTAANDP